MKFRFRIKQLIEDRDLGVRELARILSISTNTLMAYRDNEVERPDLEVVGKFCDFFGVPLDQLLVDVEDKRFIEEINNEQEHDSSGESKS